MNLLETIFCPPRRPQETGSPKNWEKLEARLGTPLPPDYKTLIDVFGTGSFADFIIVYNPFAQNEYFNLLFALDTLHQADQQIRLQVDPAWTVVRPFELYPAPTGLLPWGCTVNLEDSFFWRLQGPPPTWETILYHLRSGEYEVWKQPLGEFLYGLFTRQITSVLLPEDFPPRQAPLEFFPLS